MVIRVLEIKGTLRIITFLGMRFLWACCIKLPTVYSLRDYGIRSPPVCLSGVVLAPSLAGLSADLRVVAVSAVLRVGHGLDPRFIDNGVDQIDRTDVHDLVVTERPDAELFAVDVVDGLVTPEHQSTVLGGDDLSHRELGVVPRGTIPLDLNDISQEREEHPGTGVHCKDRVDLCDKRHDPS